MNAAKPGENNARTAISYTESATGLRVTVHDLTHSLWQLLPADRFRHAHPCCTEVKSGVHGAQCLAFEVAGFRRIAASLPEGRVHTCHAGFSEAAYPVFHDGSLVLVLFLGPFLLERNEAVGRAGPAGPGATLPSLSRADAEAALEAVRQLGARLRSIVLELPERLEARDVARGVRIRRFLLAHYQEQLLLSDLASELSLSPERTRHVVREECHMGFRELLEDTRVQAACALLLNTRLPVAEIAVRCGFRNPSSLSRVFARRYGVTPRQWRVHHQS